MIPLNLIKLYKKMINPIVNLFIFLKFTPNTVSIIGFFITLISAVLYAYGYIRIGGLILILASLFDTFDGELARRTKKSSTRGAFLDSSLDRVSEFVILVGLLIWGSTYYFLNSSFYNLKIITISINIFSFTLLIFGVLFFSIFTSYVKARAEGLNIEFNGGFFSRPERVIWISIISLIGEKIIFIGIAILLLFTIITSFERFIKIWKKFK